MRKFIILIIIIIAAKSYSITNDEIRFCDDHDLIEILERNEQEINNLNLFNPLDTIYYETLFKVYNHRNDDRRVAQLLFKRAFEFKNYADAYQLALLLEREVGEDSRYLLKGYLNELKRTTFTDSLQIQALDFYLPDSKIVQDTLLTRAPSYNYIMEKWCKERADKIAVNSDANERIEEAKMFLKTCSKSKYRYTIFAILLKTMVNEGRQDDAYQLIVRQLGNINDSLYSYIIAEILLDPKFRRNLTCLDSSNVIFIQIQKLLMDSIVKINQIGEFEYMFRKWDQEYFLNKIYLGLLKMYYYQIMDKRSLFGDEDVDVVIYSEEEVKLFDTGESYFDKIKFKNNDFGEIAENHFWKGKYYLLKLNKRITAADQFIDCLIAGAPRNKYQKESEDYLKRIHIELKVKGTPLDWARILKDYHGAAFENIFKDMDDKIVGNRVSIGDINNDGYEDICISGQKLLVNKSNFEFIDITDSTSVYDNSNSGSLWVDVDLDGREDLIVLSASSNGNGDKIFVNQGWNRLTSIEEKIGSIDDKSPTEGAACVDTNLDGFPTIYTANYQDSRYNNFEDKLWDIKNSKIVDITEKLITNVANAKAGRGVAPADYDNDGYQEIYVTNYRLNENFLYDYNDGKYSNIAGLNRLDGEDVDGYFGHSIGASWGDYDNDGDLDLFVANLAHPRYIEFSEKSVLYRNDGKSSKIVDGDEIEYYEFTNVTKQAGIKYDELHAEPNWFDADNDGDLDLYITSIYENERSYLYENLGNGTFKDITWLANSRVLNGWGTATADFNKDGLLDICIASNSGVALLKNVTDNSNYSVQLKPFWNDEMKIDLELLIDWDSNIKNSPAYGSRINFVYKNKDGEQVKLIRELTCGHGTNSQNGQFVHFGYGDGKPIKIDIYFGNHKVKTRYFN